MTEIPRKSHAMLGVALSLLFFSSVSLRAELKSAGLFGDNMILQRDSATPVWGTADAGDTITITLGEQKATATADGSENWKAIFRELKENDGDTVVVSSPEVATPTTAATHGPAIWKAAILPTKVDCPPCPSEQMTGPSPLKTGGKSTFRHPYLHHQSN